MNKRNSDVLAEQLDIAVQAGEVPYQANRRALQSLDLEDDGEGGMVEIELMLTGIDSFINYLEGLKNASRGVTSRVLASIR